MAFQSGGMADKLGNRYEKRWCIWQLLRLVNEDIVSLVFEKVRPEEDGTDLTIALKDGVIQHQQCKAQNSDRANWSIRDLGREGVLKHAAKLIQEDPHAQFAFVSSTPASQFTDLAECARQYSFSPEDFYQNLILSGSSGRRNHFEQFCNELNLAVEDQVQRTLAISVLRKCFYHHFLDTPMAWEEVKTKAGLLLSGETDNTTAILGQIVDEHLQQLLYADTLRESLCTKGVWIRKLLYDTSIAEPIEELNTRFRDAIQPGLICNTLIPRPETANFVDDSGVNDIHAVTVLHGVAGTGKSGVLFELTSSLKKMSIPYLAIRLDRITMSSSSRDCGRQLGLPDSPALSLCSIAGGRPSFLILDQLDALRWTAAHSKAAIDVCGQILREVIALRNTGNRIAVVLACRSFDLDHDPNIKMVLEGNQQQTRKISVGPLTPAQVQSVIASLGDPTESISDRQMSLLKLPQNLAIWATIRPPYGLEAPRFATRTQLMRMYWTHIRQRAAEAGVDDSAIVRLLDVIVENMEAERRLWVPLRLVQRHYDACNCLHSLGVLQTTAYKTTFCHQSYLDFLVADAVLQQITAGQTTLLKWLGTREAQLLDRRDQLTQALSLVADEEPERLFYLANELLASPSIRFHLKHLALSTLGQLDQPPEPIQQTITSLLDDEFWRPHVIENVMWHHAPYVLPLCRNSMMEQWLQSADQEKVNQALNLLRSICEQEGDVVAEVISPYVRSDNPWVSSVLGVLPFYPHSDTDALFRIRMELLKLGHASKFIAWGVLLEKKPERAIELLKTIMEAWVTAGSQYETDLKRTKYFQLDSWKPNDLEQLHGLGRQKPIDTWNVFLPLIDHLTQPREPKPWAEDFDEWMEGERYSPKANRPSVRRGIVEATISASRTIAEHDPTDFLVKASRISDSKSVIMQEILLNGYVCLDNSYADTAIQWILGRPERLSVGSGFKEPKWAPACRLIQKHSKHCSEACFKRLEFELIHYHEPDEKERARDAFECARRGMVKHWFGHAQFHLLPALDKDRISSETVSLVGELCRKFSGLPPEYFIDGHSLCGGTIVSPIRRPWELSDAAWLGIISKKDLPEEYGRMTQLDDDTAAESTIRTFSGALSLAAKYDPERFGRLALRFPSDVHPSYVASIMDSFQDSQPPQMSHINKEAWRPATIETIESFLLKFQDVETHEVAIHFCWFIRDRALNQWSESTLTRLKWYAVNHPNPETGGMSVYDANEGPKETAASIHSLETNTLNCVRGVAVMAIGRLLWDNQSLYASVRSTLEEAANDEHPSVRIAVVQACLSILRIDEDAAVQLFCQACSSDTRVAACQMTTQFLNHATRKHHPRVAPIVLAMFTSSNPEVSRKGSSEVCARWIFHGFYEEQIAACLGGNEFQRSGAAAIAAQFLGVPEHTERCLYILRRLAQDQSKDVRQNISGLYRDKSVLANAAAASFVLEYVASQAFLDDPTPLLHALDDYSGSLLPFANHVRSIADRFTESLRVSSRDISSRINYDARLIVPLLLRLYEEALEFGQREILQGCLDCIDSIFENRIGTAAELIKEIDI